MTENPDPEIEQLLSRYRPAEPKSELWDEISNLPHLQMSKSPRTWPWALAAAALLVITVVLNARPTLPLSEDTRVRVALDTLAEVSDGSLTSLPLVQWSVEARVRVAQQREHEMGSRR